MEEMFIQNEDQRAILESVRRFVETEVTLRAAELDAAKDPEDGFSYMWDDMINAPSEMGEMPGGWNAPSISVPNPVDVGSEFRRETPNLIREIPDMINVN